MLNFIKMSGAGNDFIIIDNRKNQHNLSTDNIARISQRRNIGCDQLIIIRNSNQADALMDIYNSDGSVSGSCGNATRCVSSIIMDETGRSEINIETISGILECKRQGNLIAVNMGEPKFDYQEIPMSEDTDTDSFNIDEIDLAPYRFSAVNMGNPHLITFINHDIPDEEFSTIGPMLENHPLFPEKTNVEFARITAPNRIQIRVWERGAGETLACGSGACAVAVSAIKQNLVNGRKVTTSFKGGDLLIEWRADNRVIMTGGYENICSGIIDEKFIG
jgi:diaminopimelate epimerase